MRNYENDLDLDLELDAEQNLIHQIENRIEQTDVNQTGRYMYFLRVMKSLTRIDYHRFNLEQLQVIHRKLVNGVSNHGSITNRAFFQRYFTGGVRLISVFRPHDDDYPTFSIEYILFSHMDNLDSRVMKNLTTRAKHIDRGLEPVFRYVGERDNIQLDKVFPVIHDFELSNDMSNRLGFQLVGQIQKLENQRPKYFGELYKSTKITL